MITLTSVVSLLSHFSPALVAHAGDDLLFWVHEDNMYLLKYLNGKSQQSLS